MISRGRRGQGHLADDKYRADRGSGISRRAARRFSEAQAPAADGAPPRRPAGATRSAACGGAQTDGNGIARVTWRGVARFAHQEEGAPVSKAHQGHPVPRVGCGRKKGVLFMTQSRGVRRKGWWRQARVAASALRRTSQSGTRPARVLLAALSRPADTQNTAAPSVATVAWQGAGSVSFSGHASHRQWAA